ncbi:MAG: MBL fold metallo-hydrolase [Oscillospiraceae bacterium]|nr:MBL fold metallo-hydrolase [Oscillospiraceae bacterium]
MSKLTRFSDLKPIPAESSWFKAYRVLPSVTAISEPYHFQEVISYLIEGEERALLLDSGMGLGNMKAMVEFLTDKPVTLVNSHSHFDHVGDNWRFPETHLLDLPDYVHALERGEVFQPDAENRVPEASWYEGEVWFDLKTWHTKPCKVVPIHDGDCFDLGGRVLRVLSTPGHTKDSIMLADDGNKILFTGDTIYPAPMYAYIEGPEMIPIYAETVRRLAESYSEYTLCCSHNDPLWEGSILRDIARAFRDILAGSARNAVSDDKTEGDNVFFAFAGFSIVLTRDAARNLGYPV